MKVADRDQMIDNLLKFRVDSYRNEVISLSNKIILPETKIPQFGCNNSPLNLRYHL